jgi:hypothetical protein
MSAESDRPESGGVENGMAESGMAAEHQLARLNQDRLNQDRLNEMQARSERLRATMIALAAQSNDLVGARSQALCGLPPIGRKRRRRAP